MDILNDSDVSISTYECIDFRVIIEILHQNLKITEKSRNMAEF